MIDPFETPDFETPDDEEGEIARLRAQLQESRRDNAALEASRDLWRAKAKGLDWRAAVDSLNGQLVYLVSRVGKLDQVIKRKQSALEECQSQIASDANEKSILRSLLRSRISELKDQDIRAMLEAYRGRIDDLSSKLDTTEESNRAFKVQMDQALRALGCLDTTEDPD